MAFVVFALSLALILAALWSGYMSLDLLPTPIGVLYALAGAVAASIAVLAFALGVAIRRIDALAALMRRSEPLSEARTPPGEAAPLAPAPAVELPADDASSHEVSAHQVSAHELSADQASAHQASAHEVAAHQVSIHEVSSAGPADAGVEESAPEEPAEHPINENRAGHLPTLGGVEPEPESAGPPTLVGRYASGGASYMIFSDGSIEAETTEGTFKFASMDDFKRFIAERKEGHA